MSELARFVIAGITAFVVCLLLGPTVIKILHRLKFGQSVRDDGPQTHLKKSGTPTMGGVLIIIALLIGTLAPGYVTPKVIWVLFLTLGFGLIGFLDDIIIIIKKRSMGLTARQKMFAQIVVASIATTFLLTNHAETAQRIPFTNLMLEFPVLNLSMLKLPFVDILSNIFFFVFSVFIMVGFSNAVNLTDGLDGLASGTTAVAAIIMGVFALLQGHNDLTTFAIAIAGACLGFVWFNGPPAQVFMGDTGSLALGGALAGIAMYSQLSFFLLIVGGVFVAETLSVMLQVTSFKFTGKRIFRMAPLHHHFELGGLAETKVMLRLWMVGIVLGGLGILGYIYR